ncbi:hypothetical protein DDE74_35255 [Streptomyces lydicus]|uniref:DUF3592 domain-containing protein n=1 Tax=Streptomyces lydicus TaxID=47763 RepID=A0A3Q9KGG5_9ACTN|nr:hypothetical protein DDE74_35255 [Streptomyces lydicus]
MAGSRPPRPETRVVALEWREDDQGEDHPPAAYPVVEFTSADGMPRRFQSSTGSNPPSYEKGERVEVLYRADSPEDARINSSKSAAAGSSSLSDCC